MPTDNKTVRTRREIKERLLKRAFNEGRGAEVIAKIQECISRVKEQSDADRGILVECRLNNHGQPRSVQMLNALARHAGSSERWVDQSPPPSIH